MNWIWIFIFFLLFSYNQARECTEDDYTATYTKCRNNKRNLIWYWKEHKDCTGGVDLPENKYGIRCDIACDEGYYLPFGSTECWPCSPGTISFGGGYRQVAWNSNWKSDIFEFHTYCTDLNTIPLVNSTCQGWVADSSESFIFSGNQTGDNQLSILEMPIRLITQGHLHFEYKVSAEIGYDGLIFKINNQTRINMISNTEKYLDFQETLNPGYYTFTWIYKKDFSISEGDDASFIRMIEVGGVEYADSECLECDPGTYNPSSGSEKCLPCPENTYSNSTGTITCLSCPENQYSFPGSTFCEDRLPCTELDYAIFYTPCQGPAPGHRTLYYDWVRPTICDYQNYNLPANQTGLPCEQCNPGTYQSQTNFQCTFCPTGFYSHLGETSCHPCPSGTAAIKGLYLTAFESWPKNSSTGCDGQCGTNGWRLLGDHIDSGIGNGLSESYFSLDVQLSEPGFLSFNYSRRCVGFFTCSFYFTDSGVSTISLFQAEFTTKVIRLNAGYHSLRWEFHNTPNHPDNKAILWNIQITGVQEGGASQCVTCKAGTYAPEHSSSCSNCEIGFGSAAASSECHPCPVNHFSEKPGSICMPCGQGTYSQVGSSTCINTCTYSPSEGIEYDLTALSLPNGEMHGPVTSHPPFRYFFSICNRTKNFCFDDEGNYFETNACQMGQNFGIDIGRVIGYYPNLQNERNGLTIRFTNGDPLGCPSDRKTNITMICDPESGLGFPEGDTPIEGSICEYDFIWKSLYACPLCSAADYTVGYSECDADGFQTMNYFWKSSPKRCHDGVELPSSQKVPCFNPTITCPPGQKALANNTCVDCEPGYFSLGGSIQFNQWNSWPKGFESDGWLLSGHSIVTNKERPSNLTYTDEFIIPGSISFSYKLYTSPLSKARLYFYQDGSLVKQFDFISPSYFEYSTPVSIGTHSFTWHFTMKSGEDWDATINKITINGTTSASIQCLPCPSGTYAPISRSSSCELCSINTFSQNAATKCLFCPIDEYSLIGSDKCQKMPLCDGNRIQKYYTPCSRTGTRSSYYVILENCSNKTIPSGENSLPCADCPPGSIRNDGGECQVCPDGQVLKDGACVAVPSGSYAERTTYFFRDDSESTWADGWITECTGSCGSRGWRMRGSFMDSGIHDFNVDQETDSFVYFQANLLIPGSISFDAKLGKHKLEFFIDNFPIPISQQHNQFPLSAGKHKLMWNYHLKSNTERDTVEIRNIEIKGTHTGPTSEQLCEIGSFSSQSASKTCQKCPKGTFLNMKGGTECTLCEIGSFAPKEGSSSCFKCGEGTTTTQKGAEFCTTTCKFNITKQHGLGYSLENFIEESISIPISQDETLFLWLCEQKQCALSPNSSVLTHACYQNNKQKIGFDYGSILTFIPNTGTNIRNGFSLAFTHGTSDECPSRQTLVQFNCDLQEGTPEIQDYSTSCTTNILWRTLAGCPKCTSDDFEQVSSSCKDGKQQISYLRRKTCNGPLSYDGDIKSCRIPNNVSPVFLAIGLAVFIGMLGLTAYLFYKSRKISHQYKLLQQEYSSNLGHVELEDEQTNNFTIEEDENPK